MDKIDTKVVIEELLRCNLQGLTIQEISDKINLSRNTVTKILAELKGEGKLDIREVGQAKLHQLKDG